MIRFLHLSDVHLGTNQYNSPENTRKKDFFVSFSDVINRYAIQNKADFVLICGDLFDKTRIDPNTLNQAIVVLRDLKNAGIPAFVIEGNHDNQWSRDTVSWLQFLGEHDYIKLLKPDFIEGQLTFKRCNKESPICGYYNFNDQIRIVGTQWFGSNTANIIPQIIEALQDLGPYPFTILMLHAGMEGQLAGYGAVSRAALETLRPYVNYLALGHIHKSYSQDNWIFNPGTLEACCFPEYFDPHGAILVDVDKDNSIKANLKDDYTKREFIKVYVDISFASTAEAAYKMVKDKIKSTNKEKDDKPMVELIIDGTLGFKRSELNVMELRAFAKEWFDALVVVPKYIARLREYAVGAELSIKNTREQIENTVIKDMLAHYNLFKDDSEKYAKDVIYLKNMALALESPDKMFDYLNTHLNEGTTNDENS